MPGAQEGAEVSVQWPSVLLPRRSSSAIPVKGVQEVHQHMETQRSLRSCFLWSSPNESPFLERSPYSTGYCLSVVSDFRGAFHPRTFSGNYLGLDLRHFCIQSTCPTTEPENAGEAGTTESNY